MAEEKIPKYLGEEGLKALVKNLANNDKEVEGKYVTAVKEKDGKITVERKNLPESLSSNDVHHTYNAEDESPISGKGVAAALATLPEPMIFKGSVGTGGTKTTLPTAEKTNTGHTYKVITDGTYASQAAKKGDTLISDGSKWVLIPSGDEPSGTVTSVGISVPTGLSVSGTPITESGTIAITYTNGYSIPTNAKQTAWDNKQNALTFESTPSATNKVATMKEIGDLKNSVSDGKSSIASAITNEGVTTASDATFATMATNIGTVATNKYNKGVQDTMVGTAKAENVLTDKTFTNSEGVGIDGTMPNNGSISESIGYGQSYTVPSGYHNGSGKVTNSIGAGAVTSGSATISSASYVYNLTNNNFDVTGSATIGVPSVGTAGYLSSTIGTKNTNTASLSTTVDKIGLNTTISGSSTMTPSISKVTKPTTDTWTDGANGNATINKPTTGAYIAIQSAKNTGTLTATPTVSRTGYGTVDNYDANAATATVGANASSVTYVPIKGGTVTASGSGASTSTSLSGTTLTVSRSVTPSVTKEGWVSSGTAGTVTTTATVPTQTKSATPTTGTQEIKPDTGKLLSSVTINPMPNGSLNSIATQGVTYTENTADTTVIPAEGALYINAGYIPNTKITLGHMIPDDKDYDNAGTDNIMTGFEAYDTNGKKLIGTMGTATSTVTGGGLSKETASGGGLTGGGLTGGGLTAGNGEVSVTPGTVTPSVGGTSITKASTYGITSTKPSGTDGTNYLTFDPGASVTTDSKAKGRGSVSRAAVTRAEITRAAFSQTVTRADINEQHTAGFMPADENPVTAIASGSSTVTLAKDTIAADSTTIGATSGTSNWSSESTVNPTIAAGTNYYVPVRTVPNPTVTVANNGSISASTTYSSGIIAGNTSTGTGSAIPTSTSVDKAGNVNVYLNSQTTTPVYTTTTSNSYNAGVSATKVGNATAANVLSGKTFTNSTTVGATGTMTNNSHSGTANVKYGSETTATHYSDSTLNCGNQYRIPAGYHDGKGVVTANSLASQTGVDSGKTAINAANVYTGYQGWVNGNKITGTMGNATVTSGSATISSTSYTYNSTNDNFNVTGSATIGAPTVGTNGYISSTLGTKNTNTASLSTTVAKVGVGATISGTTTKQPTIAKVAKPSIDTWTDAAGGNATTTKPTSGAYIEVQSAANTGTLTATPSVTSAGYGTTSNYASANATQTVGASASAATYIPVKGGSATTPTASAASTSTSLSGTTLTVARSVTPTVSEGWVSSGTAGTVTITGTVPTQTKSATPTTSSFDVKPDSGKLLSAVTVNAMPSGSLNNAATTGVTYTESTAASTIIPAEGALYINAGYIPNTKITLAHLIPDDANYTNAGTGQIRSGYEAYDTNGKKLIGTIADVTPKFTGGTASLTGTSNTISTNMITATSGDYYIDATAKAKATRTAVTYNGAATGYVNVASGTSASAANTSAEQEINASRIYIKAAEQEDVSISTDDKGKIYAQFQFSEGYTPGTTVGISTGQQGATVTSGSATISSLSYNYDSTNKNYKVTGSGTVSAPTVDVGGYINTSVGTKKSNTASVSATVSAAAGSVTMTPGSGSVTGSNVTLSDTNNGISVTGKGAVSATAKITTAGYTPTNTNFATGSSTNSNSATKYITAVTVPKDVAFSVSTTADTALDATSNLTISNAAYRQVAITNAANGDVNITNSGQNDYTAGGASAGNLTVNAYNSSSALTGAKTIVSAGKWSHTNLNATSTGGTYYGEITFTKPTQKATQTYYTSTSDQTISSGNYLTGTQTILAVKTANIDAGNIKKGVTVTVGDANSAGRIKNVTGTLDYVKTVTSVPTTQDTSIIYNSTTKKYYIWK